MIKEIVGHSAAYPDPIASRVSGAASSKSRHSREDGSAPW